jgi:hypothetical protein
MEVIFVAEKVGNAYRGEVVNLATHATVSRTGLYSSAEAAKSAAASLWRAKNAAQVAQLRQVRA